MKTESPPLSYLRDSIAAWICIFIINGHHSTIVLNINSDFDPQESDLVGKRPVLEKIASNNDVATALMKVKNSR